MRPAYESLRPVPNRHPSRPSRARRLRAFLHLRWRKLRAGDPRATSTVTLSILILCVALNFAAAPRPVVSDPGAVNRLAEAGPRATAVRMLDGKPRSDACDNQTWPYIDQRCLRTATASPAKPADAQPDNAQANPVQRPTSNKPAGSEADKLASIVPPSSAPDAPQPSATLHDVPMPQPRPQIEDEAAELDDEDSPYPPPYYGRRYGPDGRPLMYPPPRYMDPREARAWQRYEYREHRPPRRARHELHIGGFRFRF
jgi:hypothetical protein